MLRAERLTPLPAPRRGQPAAQTPLTHHEILGLVGPFTRSGRAVDLAASDRLARRLDFKPQARAEAGLHGPLYEHLQEQLRLEDIGHAGFALTRTLLQPGGGQAVLEAEGPDIATLLRWVDAVPPDAHWRSGPGWHMVLHHRLVAPGRREGPQAPPELILTRAQAWFAGLRLDAMVSRVKNVPAALELRAESTIEAGADVVAPPTLPEDLLAVLGLDWSRLARFGAVWRATVRVKGDGAQRSRNAENKLQEGVQHLAGTLAETPGRFHERFASARWRVTLRRGFPLLVCLGLIGASAAVPWMGITRESVYQMLVFNAPPILMVWLFSMRELPRIEIPPLPRRPADADWNATSGDR